MATLSFKSDDQLKKNIGLLAQKKGINTSAYIKLILTKEVNNELSEITENGLTVAEELEILSSLKKDKKYGPFKTAKDFMKSLEED